jgi:hypothetical protein
MDCTKLIGEEHCTTESPLLIVLPPVEEQSTKEEAGYLIEQLRK